MAMALVEQQSLLSEAELTDLKEEWIKLQDELKNKLILHDTLKWQLERIISDEKENADDKEMVTDDELTLVGGVDISFIKGDEVSACASLVVLRLPSLKIAYEKCKMIKLTAPYVPGFLAFREVPPLLDLINELRQHNESLTPQLIIVDGNGVLHPRGCGLACHLGVETGIPTFGVAKNFFVIDGIEKNHLDDQVKNMKLVGESVPIIGESGRTWGMAVKSTAQSTKPIFVSSGHLVSVETAVWVLQKCTKYRVPEPTRQADILSREYLRQLENPDKKSSKK